MKEKEGEKGRGKAGRGEEGGKKGGKRREQEREREERKEGGGEGCEKQCSHVDGWVLISILSIAAIERGRDCG